MFNNNMFNNNMCNNNIQLYTTARYIHKNAVTNFKNSCACGMCADCIRKKRLEWRMRAYYEAKSTKNFVLFDTLTYEDSKLVYFHDIYPRALYNAWDFMAFSRDDLKKFFKRLRSNLQRGCTYYAEDFHCFGLPLSYKWKPQRLPAFGDISNKLRYLVTSEYGTSNDYNGVRCTHRPHYHVLFFVSFDIDPLLFSKYVAVSWMHGRTDGIPYKTRNYVLNNRVFLGSTADNLKLINYVTKYITKDLYLYKKLFNRVYTSYSISNPDWQKDYQKRLEFRRFKNQVLPFHLQSLHFGDSAFDYENSDYIDEHFAIRMPINGNGVVASIPLSMSMLRKRYFTHQKIDGRVVWKPNQNYFTLKKNRFYSAVINLRNRLFSWKNDLGLVFCECLARYQLLWRGKLIHYKHLNYTDAEMLDEVYKSQPLLSYAIPNNRVWYGYLTEKDGYRHGKRICEQYDVQHHAFLPVLTRDRSLSWSPKEFEEYTPFPWIVVNSKNVPRFSGYDAVLDEYNCFLFEQSKIADYQQFEKERQNERYKMLGFKV